MEPKKNKRKGRSGAKNAKRGKPQKNRTPSAKELLLPHKQQVRHSTAEIPDVKVVQEPLPTCPICGKTIENIAEAITRGDGAYCHFDCVVDQIRESEHPAEGQSISYIGSGTFAVVQKDAEGHYTIVKRIPYESKETFDAMKKYVEGTKA